MRRRFTSKRKTSNVEYCAITATQDNTSIECDLFESIYYAINDTSIWNRGSTLIIATLNTGDTVYLKASGDTSFNIRCDKAVELSGNILSLVYGDNPSNKTSLSHITYSIASFSNVISVPSNFLPSKDLGKLCYRGMFSKCPGLTTAPELPATNLAEYCYSYMFDGCTSLVDAPALPATTLARECYSHMFYNCIRLTTAPALPATTLARECYEYMFEGCSSLNYIKMLATDISTTDCLHSWVNGVSPTGTFVKSKNANWNTTPGALGYDGVPAGWTVVNDGEESGGDSLFPATIIYSYDNENIPNYTIAKYFIDTYPDMVVDNNGAYTPITEDVTIQGSNYCDGKVVGVAKWVDGKSLLFYTENSISKWFALKVFVDYGFTPNGSTSEFFTD